MHLCRSSLKHTCCRELGGTSGQDGGNGEEKAQKEMEETEEHSEGKKDKTEGVFSPVLPSVCGKSFCVCVCGTQSILSLYVDNEVEREQHSERFSFETHPALNYIERVSLSLSLSLSLFHISVTFFHVSSEPG